MSTMKKIQEDSKFQYSLRWFVEQIILVVVATAVCILASINF